MFHFKRKLGMPKSKKKGLFRQRDCFILIRKIRRKRWENIYVKLGLHSELGTGAIGLRPVMTLDDAPAIFEYILQTRENIPSLCQITKSRRTSCVSTCST